MELSERKQKILKAIVDLYIRSAEPVGSKTIAALPGMDFSSATIRNEMAELTNLGFLEQPHTSAGRIPSPAGYRFYIDRLMQDYSLSVDETKSINQAMELRMQEFDRAMSQVGKLVSKETKVDILVTPAVTILVGVGLSAFCAPSIGAVASAVGNVIMWATELQPLLMGIVVSVLVGVALTLPISSAAICAALGLTGLAGGAAVAGCCAQMIGFAFMSYRENGVGGLVSQGLGTSMLQMPNILRNPRIWIPPTLAAAITGPIATCLFRLEMNGPAVSSGMGTCGLVGQIGVYTGWIEAGKAVTAFDWVGLVLICFVLPAVLSVVFCEVLRKWGWIKDGDMKLD